MSLIEVEHVSKRFGGTAALGDVSFTIASGEWVAIMGPSGSGKTTLVNLLGCLDTPSEGAIRILGQDLARMTPAELSVFRRETVGFVFQQYHLVPYLTALENVMLAQYLHSMAAPDEAARALDEVGLGDRRDHRPAQLSGGEQQRVCIARALINHPQIVLADEPTGNLDAESASTIMQLFERMHEAGRTILMVTHSDAIGRLADRRLVLEHGKLAGVVISREQEELFDEVLQQVWEQVEVGGGVNECADQPRLLENQGVLHAMIGQGLLEQVTGGVKLTSAGHGRARDLIRRHRLAERLFRDTFEMQGEQIESNACLFEHVLSPEVTDSICRFLNHPRSCPHNRPIPKGDCCG